MEYWVVDDACGRCHRGLCVGSLRGHGTPYWVVADEGGASGTFGGAPHGATKRHTGWWLTHAGGATGTF
eukprot:3043495-Pyramimonas_sp.AAC.1